MDEQARIQRLLSQAHELCRCYCADDWDDTNPTFEELLSELVKTAQEPVRARHAALLTAHAALAERYEQLRWRAERACDDCEPSVRGAIPADSLRSLRNILAAHATAAPQPAAKGDEHGTDD